MKNRRTSFNLRLTNSFLDKDHFYTLKLIERNNPPKQSPNPWKGPNLQASTWSEKTPGKHQCSPHLPIKRLQIWEVISQWRNRWLIHSSVLHRTQTPNMLSTSMPLFPTMSATDAFPATSNQQKTSTLGVAKPKQTYEHWDIQWFALPMLNRAPWPKTSLRHMVSKCECP